MIRKYDEDLFADSTMTFGEHLEELRTCLIKALLGLLVGFGIGLYFGDAVVRIVKGPLEEGLRNHYSHGAVDDYAAWVNDPNTDKNQVPYTVAQVKNFVEDQHFIYKKFMVHPNAVRKQLAVPEQAAPPPPSPPPTDADADPEEEPLEPLSDGSFPLRPVSLVPLFVWRPMTEDERMSIKTLNAQEAFMIWLKASLVAGFILSSPWVFYQIWIFVAAGLYPHEKKYIHVFLPFSLVLFLSGAVFCFIVVFPYILQFLFSFNRSLGIDPDPRISEWISFAIFLPVGFGISFQLPLVMLFLERIGVFTVKAYLEKWRIAVLVIAILSMLLTPADPMSMIAMEIPLTALYFGGIILCRYFPREKGMLEE